MKTGALRPDEAWSRLGLFQARDVLERKFQERHRRQLSAEKASEIISHLTQGQQYFRSAESAGILAAPLEQYYGVLAFARAMILYLDSRAREAKLTRSHGLRAVLPENGSIEETMLTVEKGTFDEFLNATGNVEQLSFDLPSPERETGTQTFFRSLPRPTVGSAFPFVELLARLPGLRHHFEEAFGRTAHCYRAATWFFMATLSLEIRRDRAELPTLTTLASVLRLADRSTCQETESERRFDIAIQPGDSIAALLPNIIDDMESDEQTVVVPFPDGSALNELAAYFAAAHAVSMLVRYHPTRWARLLSHEKGDRLLPLLERLRQLIQTQFVRLLLWEFERPVPSVPPMLKRPLLGPRPAAE